VVVVVFGVRLTRFRRKGSVRMLRSGFSQPKLEHYREAQGCNTKLSMSFPTTFLVTIVRDRLRVMQSFPFLMQPNRR
jgi:hypothetical protein